MATGRYRLNYKDALQWIIDHTDLEWINDQDGAHPETVAFAAAVFSRKPEQITTDLRALIAAN